MPITPASPQRPSPDPISYTPQIILVIVARFQTLAVCPRWQSTIFTFACRLDCLDTSRFLYSYDLGPLCENYEPLQYTIYSASVAD